VSIESSLTNYLSDARRINERLPDVAVLIRGHCARSDAKNDGENKNDFHLVSRLFPK